VWESPSIIPICFCQRIWLRVPPGGEHPDTLKLLIKTFDVNLFFAQLTLHWS
jgi:hypothetical protein